MQNKYCCYNCLNGFKSQGQLGYHMMRFHPNGTNSSSTIYTGHKKSKKIKLEHLNNALHDNSIMGDNNNDTSNINIEEDSNNDVLLILLLKQMFRNFKMNADTNKYDCDTVNILRNMFIDVETCNKPELKKYSEEIKIIILKDNEDDNYYKKTY